MAASLARPDFSAPVGKKKVIVRRKPERSRLIRGLVQALFLALNVWIGIQFYRFVRFYETAGQSGFAARPDGVEGWLPIAALMNLKAFVLTGQVPPMHAAGMFLLIAFLTISFVFRKAFCGWLCPVGTVSEWLWRLGRDAFKRNFRLPRWLDLPLRGLKYILLGLFLYAVGSMSVEAIRAFLGGPYGLVADVKMLNFFRFLSVTGGIVIAALMLASVFVQNFWCRYLCPYGAMLGLASLPSPFRIRRDPEKCIDCAKCAKACPSALAVDKLVTIRSVECMSCMDCVSACPVDGALQFSVRKSRHLPGWSLAVGIAVVFFGIVGYAQWAGYWRTDLPSETYQELVPRAAEFGHP